MTAKLSTADLKAMLAGITPGPWGITHDDDGSAYFVSDAAEIVPHFSTINASAIAQVPALLAEVIALRTMLDGALDSQDCNGYIGVQLCEEIRAALEGTQ